MKKIKLLILVFFAVEITASAQDLSPYQYVKVPEKFEFLSDENEYQLNALTAFLFEKYGFNVLYDKNIPEGTPPCKILNANVINESNIFRTKVKLNLENCHDEIVFASKIGKSIIKDYKRSYQDALRDAFQSVKELEYKYVAGPDKEPVRLDGEHRESQNPIASKEVAAEEVNSVEQLEGSKEMNYYVNGNQRYRLQKTRSGFTVSRVGVPGEVATLMKSSSGKNYIYSSDNVKGNAFFDAAGNLIVEYVTVDTNQLVTLEYKLED